ncbi:hypothetical protein [Methylotenera versatilis]|uniref:hypothetical protein n=1 Tax=Methylotenera versatilis TaxID=1055487 RepID=UPI001F441363|nr:hypothetical protein [Methylotenera versatilis]
MMDNKSLVLLSKFSVSARRLIGSVNPAKLIKDSEYSAEVFQKAFELGDEELIMLSLEVQAMLGLIIVSSSAESTAKVTTIKPAAEPEQKYMFGARS